MVEKRKRGPILGALVSFAVVIVAIWAFGKWLSKDGTARLTPEILESNELLWSSKGLKDYDLSLLKNVDRSSEERYEVRVRASAIAEMKLNGNLVKRPNNAYTIRGLFDTMRRELEMAEAATKSDGVSRQALVFASFAGNNGLPLRIKRLAGQGQSFVLDVDRLVDANGSVVYEKSRPKESP